MLNRIRKAHARRRFTLDLLAFHRSVFGDLRMEAPDEGGTGGAENDRSSGGTGSAEHGNALKVTLDGEEFAFPANTQLAEMNPAQQIEYWRHKARKHESAVKSRSDYDALKTKAEQYDRLEQASKTEHERALEEAKKVAREEGKAESAKENLPKLVRAKFEAVAAGRIVDAEGRLDTKRLDALLEPLDMSRFITDSGDVDTDKVLAFVETAAPKDDRNGKGGFPDLGQGRRQATGQPSVQSGADLFAARHKKNAQQTA
jgi:hypothetical protein